MILAYFAPLDSHGGPLVWLFGNGIGINIGASLIWGFLAGFVGYLVAKRVKKAWGRLHTKIDAHRNETRQHLRALHERHDEHARSLDELHEKLAALTLVKPVARVAPKRVATKPAAKPRSRKA